MARATGSCGTGRARARVVGALLFLLAAACSVAQKDQPAPDSHPLDPCANSAQQQQVQTLLAARQSRSGSDAAYIVSPGDLLVVTIYNYRPQGGDFSSDVRVDDRGYISLPMIEPMHVAGASVAQVHHAIVAGLRRAEVLNEPLVSVFVKDYQGQELVVLGAVARPGMYHLSRGKQTLVDVLSMAGGLTPTAGNYVLMRPARTAEANDSGSVAQAYAIQPAAAKDPWQGVDAGSIPICFDNATGDPDPALLMLQVRGGDLVIVPEAGKAFIEGEVRTPGPYPLTRGMTLTQLISSAGGLTFPADLTRVKLIRQVGTADSGEWQVNIEPRENQPPPDVRLTRNDRVVIPSTLGRKAVYGVYQFVTAVVRITVGGAATVF